MLRVLIVDDNPIVADTLAMLVQAFGHDVCTCYSGVEAIFAAPTHLPHVALIDIGMPHMDGWETARRIRQLPEGSRISLVAVSGYGSLEDEQKSEEAGFDRHLLKPVDVEALEAYLESLARSLRSQPLGRP